MTKLVKRIKHGKTILFSLIMATVLFGAWQQTALAGAFVFFALISLMLVIDEVRIDYHG